MHWLSFSNGNGAPMTDNMTLLTQFSGSAVPEPASLVMAGTSLAIGLAGSVWRRAAQARA